MVLYLPPLRESGNREAWILVTRSLCRSVSHPFVIFTADVGSLDSAFSSLKMRCLSGFLKGCLESRRMVSGPGTQKLASVFDLLGIERRGVGREETLDKRHLNFSPLGKVSPVGEPRCGGHMRVKLRADRFCFLESPA